MEGLFRRGGMWWARLVVPARLREAAGRREFVKSTGTHEYALGKIVAAALLADWRKQLLQLEQRGMQDEALLRLVDGGPALAGAGYVSLAQATTVTGLDLTDLLSEAAAGRLALGCRVPRGCGTGFVAKSEHLARADPIRGGLEVPPEPPRTSLTVDLSNRALRLIDGGQDVAEAILAEQLERVELVALESKWGNPGAVFCPDRMVVCEVADLVVDVIELERLRLARAALIAPARIDRARGARAASSTSSRDPARNSAHMRFSEAVARYCADPDGLPGELRSASEQRQRRAGLMLFAEFMDDPALTDISTDLLRQFRDGPLKLLPGNANRLPRPIVAGKSMQEIVAALANELPDWPRMSAGMQRERMLWIIRLLDWAVAERLLPLNPGAALREKTGLTKAQRRDLAREKAAKRRKVAVERGIPGDEDEEGREPFSEAQLQKIFAQPQFATGHGRHARGNRVCDPFEYWLPLLGLYHGLRIKEASQLHLADVREVEGNWCLDINETTADKVLKNEQSTRLIPISPELVKLGFLAYCDRLRAEGFQRVFPELTYASSDARYAKESGRKMPLMLKELGMPRDGTLVFHCLRHNTNNALMRVPATAVPGGDEQLKTFIRYKLMGHQLPEDANNRHYTSASTAEVAALVAALKYELPPIERFDLEFGIESVRAALQRKTGDRQGCENMGPLGLSNPAARKPTD